MTHPCQSIRCTNIYFWNIFRSKCNEPVWHNLCVWLISGWDFIQAFTVSWRNYMHGYKTNNLIVDYFNFIIIVVFFIFLINLYIPFSQNAVLNICLKSNEFFSVSTDSWHLKVFLPSPFNLCLLFTCCLFMIKYRNCVNSQGMPMCSSVQLGFWLYISFLELNC